MAVRFIIEAPHNSASEVTTSVAFGMSSEFENIKDGTSAVLTSSSLIVNSILPTASSYTELAMEKKTLWIKQASTEFGNLYFGLGQTVLIF